MSSTDPLHFTKNEAMQIPRPQIPKAQCLVPEMPSKKSPHDG